MSLSIRVALPQDVPALVALLSQDGAYSGLGAMPYQTEQNLRDKIEAKAGKHALVGVVDQIPVALAILHRDTGRKAHSALFEVVVRDDHWGQGFGRAMVEALLDIADNWMGLARVACEVHATNTRAVALYESLGFEREGLARAAVLSHGKLIDIIWMARVRPVPQPNT